MQLVVGTQWREEWREWDSPRQYLRSTSSPTLLNFTFLRFFFPFLFVFILFIFYWLQTVDPTGQF